MSGAAFPIDPVLTGMVLAYRNRRMIADMVLPRLQPAMKEEYQYYLWKQEQAYSLPDTTVGRKSAPNEVEFEADRLTGKSQDYALDDFVPQTDIDNAAGSVDPTGNAAIGLTDLIDLGREQRTAGLVFNAATYPTGNKVQLGAAAQWNQADSTPIKDINAGLDVPLLRPNTMVLGRLVWTQLRSHPDIMKAVNRTAGDAGNARVRDVAELFELDNLYVGEAFINTVKKGQTPAMSRLWGKHCALIYLDPLVEAPMSNRITFGWTYQFGTRVGPENVSVRTAGQLAEPKRGLRGGVTVRVGEGVEERVVANDLGYFIEDAIA